MQLNHELARRKSSHSANNGGCVEVAPTGGCRLSRQ
ncbi:DUF397 domain-containing protein [Bailinhaonella thermotolerans]